MLASIEPDAVSALLRERPTPRHELLPHELLREAERRCARAIRLVQQMQYEQPQQQRRPTTAEAERLRSIKSDIHAAWDATAELALSMGVHPNRRPAAILHDLDEDADYEMD
ncbi:hypothetical protein M3697_10825 [Janibacter melonis]|uniref:hypothetical protein n=1 Tax=Janibacter melonis TaxID=262209 RepID=UPI002044AD55|nr:hypothetical protein [Janibacter melonis]MCM3555596.1 hypothetical protein [Janibacter melonis]